MQMPYAPDFAEWLENERKLRGISQAELARRAGVTRGAINGVLSGARGPGVDLVRGIADALGLPAEQVMRAAGLLPPAPQLDEKVERVIHEVADMTDEEKRELLAYIKMRKDLRRGGS